MGRLSPLPGMNFPPDVSSFVQITIPSRLSYVIPPYSYWNMQFYQSEGAYITWEIGVPRGASIGFYAKRNARPSHTNHDIIEILRGFKTRTTRSSPVRNYKNSPCIKFITAVKVHAAEIC